MNMGIRLLFRIIALLTADAPGSGGRRRMRGRRRESRCRMTVHLGIRRSTRPDFPPPGNARTLDMHPIAALPRTSSPSSFPGRDQHCNAPKWKLCSPNLRNQHFGERGRSGPDTTPRGGDASEKGRFQAIVGVMSLHCTPPLVGRNPAICIPSSCKNPCANRRVTCGGLGVTAPELHASLSGTVISVRRPSEASFTCNCGRQLHVDDFSHPTFHHPHPAQCFRLCVQLPHVNSLTACEFTHKWGHWTHESRLVDA
jgi:hypothetical protein